MTITSDDQLVTKVARELASPEPAVHFGASLVVATLVASPVLAAAATGRQEVPTALVLYLAALVVVWVLGGFVGGALAMARSGRVDTRSAAPADGPEPGSGSESPPATSDSVGSNGAH